MAYTGYGMPDMSGTFARLGDLGNVYDRARLGGLKQKAGEDVATALRSGQPVDYGQLASTLAQAGDLSTAFSLLKLGEERKAGDEFTRSLASLAGLQGGAPSEPSAPPMSPLSPGLTTGPRPANAPPLMQGGAVNLPPPAPPSTTARVEVPSSPRVWGDREAEDAGLYEPPATGSASPPLPPQRPMQTAQAPLTPPAPREPMPQQPVGRVSQPSQNPAGDGRLMLLAAAVARPGLGANQRAVGMEFLKRELENSKQPDEVRKYIWARAQGDPRATSQGFTDWLESIKRAGAPPAGEKEYDKVWGKNLAEFNVEMIKSANNARGKIATLSRLDQLLSNPAVYTGTGGAAVAGLKRLGASLGLDVSGIQDGAATGDAIRSISNQFALELRNPAGGAGMPGAMSDKDREFLQAMVPGLGQTPEGNKILVDYMKRVAQRSIDVERQRQAYVRRNGRLDEGFFNHLANWSDANPMFPEADTTKPPAAAATPPPPPADDGWTTINGVKIRRKQ